MDSTIARTNTWSATPEQLGLRRPKGNVTSGAGTGAAGSPASQQQQREITPTAGHVKNVLRKLSSAPSPPQTPPSYSPKLKPATSPAVSSGASTPQITLQDPTSKAARSRQPSNPRLYKSPNSDEPDSAAAPARALSTLPPPNRDARPASIESALGVMSAALKERPWLAVALPCALYVASRMLGISPLSLLGRGGPKVGHGGGSGGGGNRPGRDGAGNRKVGKAPPPVTPKKVVVTRSYLGWLYSMVFPFGKKYAAPAPATGSVKELGKMLGAQSPKGFITFWTAVKITVVLLVVGYIVYRRHVRRKTGDPDKGGAVVDVLELPRTRKTGRRAVSSLPPITAGGWADLHLLSRTDGGIMLDSEVASPFPFTEATRKDSDLPKSTRDSKTRIRR
ncbi:hypothetical protein HK101_003431 [Irineochytrium annulatum]|nr:hypothetical protein HK101_003431 [Irineochytrium annulatum]